MAAIVVSGSERMIWWTEMGPEGRALVVSGGAAPTQIDLTKEEKMPGQGLVETLQAQGLGVCLRGRIWQYQLLSIWHISTCSLSVRQLMNVDDGLEMGLPIQRRQSLGKLEGLRRSWQLPGTSSR